jgi:hypothetical protein
MSADPLSTTVRFLLARGFKVETNARVVGLSGLAHSFAVKASKGQLQLFLDVVESVEDLLAFYGKALDLRGVPSLALVRIKEETPEMQQALHCVSNALAFKTSEELEEILPKALALVEAGENAQRPQQRGGNAQQGQG